MYTSKQIEDTRRYFYYHKQAKEALESQTYYEKTNGDPRSQDEISKLVGDWNIVGLAHYLGGYSVKMRGRPAKVCSHGVSLSGLFTCTGAYIYSCLHMQVK